LFVLAACGSSRSNETTRDGGGGGADGAPSVAATSCKAGGAGVTSCGTAGDGCCTTLDVPAGTFFRSYDDGVSTEGTSDAYPATLSAVSIDKYEVTVGRFRVFVAAELGGYRPAAGSGKHSELTAGGLNAGAEAGWDSSWNASFATSEADWSAYLACDPAGSTSYATWTASAGSNEEHPINCVDWYEAYAFCIWDGGFLPTEAEWNYAAAGGSDQRAYPWSSPAKSTTLDCAHADYELSCAEGTTKVGADSPTGDGLWGHSDLGGNVFEWNLDWYGEQYPMPCDDCANLTPAQFRVIRGGSFDKASTCLLNALRESSAPDGRSSAIGFRCARP
jgi:formylglycine-generating enzyme required for sulfatase activity